MAMVKKRILTYWHVWRLLASNAVQETFVNRGTNALFLFGKVIRLTMSLVFLFIFVKTVPVFAGFSTDQLYVFFITFTLIDQISQMLLRGVYLFTNLVRRGEFDFILTKPISSLFLSLIGSPDINDAIFLIPTVIVSGFLLSTLDLTVTPISLLLYIALFINGLLIATAFHITALIVGILTTEVDGVMWLYRDLSRLATFPVTIYFPPIPFLLFFIFPVGMMVTIPSQVLIGMPTTYHIALAFFIGIGSFLLSLYGWKYALRSYTSASS